MRIAAIDIGSNSIHIIVCRIRPDLSFEVVDREKDMIRLASGTLAKRRLPDPNIATAMQTSMDPAALDKPFLDFRKYPLEGVRALDAHTLRIRIIGKYPQWKYWLAMTFTAPIPWEADQFYAQPGMAKNGLTLNVWPAGTGP